MSVLTRILDKRIVHGLSRSIRFYSGTAEKQEDEFRVLNIKQTRSQTMQRKKTKKEILPPRTEQMAVDQDWGSVWPGPRTFHPAVVPLPVRQGYVEKGTIPDKYGNAELMKIPNFLHLTPPVVKRQCEALRKFCTSWPKALDSDEKCEQHFPIEIISSNYCHSSPTIRDPLARIVTMKIKLSSLKLNDHAKDKFRRLVGDRYDEKTDILTIVTDRCPTRKQNYDYAMYLLTALYHEAWASVEKKKGVIGSTPDVVVFLCHTSQNFLFIKLESGSVFLASFISERSLAMRKCNKKIWILCMKVHIFDLLYS